MDFEGDDLNPLKEFRGEIDGGRYLSMEKVVVGNPSIMPPPYDPPSIFAVLGGTEKFN